MRSNAFSGNDGQSIQGDGCSDMDCRGDSKSDSTKALDLTVDVDHENPKNPPARVAIYVSFINQGKARAKYRARCQ